MISVKVVPQGCLCGWTIYDSSAKLWLTRKDPFCQVHGDRRIIRPRLRQHAL